MTPKSAESPTPAWPSLPPIAHALAAQAIAWLLTECLQLLLGGTGGWSWAAGQGILAALAGRLFGLPWWWAPLNALFVPLTIASRSAGIDGRWYLAAFLLLAAVYWSTFRSRVPLYLSSRLACDAIAELLPTDRAFHFLDIGCGIGTVLARLAPRFPNGEFRGIEIAPIPFVWSWVRGRFAGGFQTRRRNFWRESLAGEDVVYAFLSPVPMAELWRKARQEMRPGSLFISNSFRVDGVPADQVIALGDGRRTLHVWRM
ncbi:MAG: class I SAM-dependent methyltransferase [Betaproteobacteria bacterium]